MLQVFIVEFFEENLDIRLSNIVGLSISDLKAKLNQFLAQLIIYHLFNILRTDNYYIEINSNDIRMKLVEEKKYVVK